VHSHVGGSRKDHEFWLDSEVSLHVGAFSGKYRASFTRDELQSFRVQLQSLYDTLKGEAFGFLGFELRRKHKREKDGYYIYMTPKKKARKAIKAKIRDIIATGGASTAAEIVTRINAAVAGWVEYFRVGNSSRAFSEVRHYMEMKIRILLTRRKRRRKRGIGWRRWSSEYLYDVLGLYWDWKLKPLPGLGNPVRRLGGCFFVLRGVEGQIVHVQLPAAERICRLCHGGIAPAKDGQVSLHVEQRHAARAWRPGQRART